MRIVYIGCVESSYVFLKALIENGANIVGVITKEGSLFNSDFKDLKPLCNEFSIPILYTISARDQDTIDCVKNWDPDLIFCFGWSHLLEEKLIEIPRLGVVGYHPAALPNNRGRHPIIWALALGLSETASTFFMIDKTADTGAIVSQESIPILEEDDARSLMDKVLEKGKNQVVELLNQFSNNTVSYKIQDISTGNSWRKRSKKDGEIDWRMSSKAIYNLVRALTRPYIGAHFVYQGKDVKVWKVRVLDTDGYNNIEPGKVINISENGNMIVKTGDGMIELLQMDNIELAVGDYL